MRVVISAGGTGGHIYPALALINKIKEKEPNSEFLYIGTHNRMEKDIIPAHGIPFETIEMYGFNRKNIFKNFKTIKSFINSYFVSRKLIRDFNPNIVIGFGGYVTGPVVYAAKNLGYNTFIHEQNSIPGKANLFLSKYVTTIGVSFKSSIKHFPEYKTIFTGNPCGEDAVTQPPLKKNDYKLNPNKKLIYIVMGSLGSSKISEILIKTMSLFKGKDYEVLFVTGKESYEEVKKHKLPSNVFIEPYIEQQTRMMKNADLIVTRCGATTLSEIIALNIPSILIPSPYVPDNHQYKNAMDLVNKDGAVMIEEKNLKGDILVRTIDELINDEKRIKIMKKNLDSLKIPKSATKIYETIKEIIDRK
ncbi:MAG: undecaprenyldiphospho-muramoylpentapeptide beta-N-acetylglucosaminyltransferase [Bacilli bacterium]|nr:undecaprenyldiphospho-muramoylpentapeptide beta-N-acetylglucosaminyltransferase [Bacilli bacterium]MDD4282620.1 undecaprenyldiphospho-muramoylpentapeptide beta-N-acetylglucosaminyltransferase [Bacilli bacterium]MDD4718651.1 undecaprenyldiphospho-muramoylpentapeptide beta-N-acetylglucosaminyltransferase [Bacilli bacterium]